VYIFFKCIIIFQSVQILAEKKFFFTFNISIKTLSPPKGDALLFTGTLTVSIALHGF